MSHWIDDIVPKELARRQSVKAFLDAGDAYLHKLLESMKQDLLEFEKHFPDEQVRLQEESHGLTVFRFLPGATVGLTVVVRLDPIEKMISYDMPGSTSIRGIIRANIVDGNLVLDPESGTEPNLFSRFLLARILFPGLSEDPGILGFVKKQLNPRKIQNA